MKAEYTPPKILKIKIEDKKLVAMSACNNYLQDPNNSIEGDYVVDRYSNRLLIYDSSL